MANSWANIFGPGGKLIVDKASKGAVIDQYGTLNPEQKSLTQTLGPTLTQRIQAGPQQYSGPLNADFSGNEQQALDRFNGTVQQGYDTLGKFNNYDDASFNDQFQKEITDPSFDSFNRNVKPLIEESLPTFSTERGRQVTNAASDLNNSLMQQRFTAREAAKDRSIRSIAEYQNLGRTDLALNAVPREIKQAGYDREFAKWVGENQQHATAIDQALNFLGISTVTRQDNTFLDRLIALTKSGAQIATAASGGGKAAV